MKWINPRNQRLKIKEMVYDQIMQGCNPHGLALTCAIGVVLGCMPILGVTTVLCLILGHILKLNQALLQAVNYAMTPIHLLMLPVFFSAGHSFSNREIPSLNPRVFTHELFTNTASFFSRYGHSVLLALLAWIIAAPIIGASIYFIARSAFSKTRLKIDK